MDLCCPETANPPIDVPSVKDTPRFARRAYNCSPPDNNCEWLLQTLGSSNPVLSDAELRSVLLALAVGVVDARRRFQYTYELGFAIDQVPPAPTVDDVLARIGRDYRILQERAEDVGGVDDIHERMLMGLNDIMNVLDPLVDESVCPAVFDDDGDGGQEP